MSFAQHFEAKGEARRKAQAALNVLRETGDFDLAVRVSGLTVDQLKAFQAQLSNENLN